jgi:hypothetical protein
MTGNGVTKTVALMTPTYRGDLDRFELLCDSIDRFVSGYEQHIVIVNDDDLPFFARFESGRRVILPSSRFLPPWLRALPPFVSRKGRRTWWSFRSGPLHGWHIQQLLKIAGALHLPYQRYCIVDSDNAFFRPFDVAAYAGSDQVPLYVDRQAIRAEAPLHAVWVRNSDRLLGGSATPFPADDFIGNVLVWDKATLRDMTATIESVTGTPWAVALGKTRSFSEYILYGYFVGQSPTHRAMHRLTTQSLATSYWEGEQLDEKALTAMVDGSPADVVALCVESFSSTPVSLIRQVVGLADRDMPTQPQLLNVGAEGADAAEAREIVS